MVQYQGEQIGVSPFTLVCINLHNHLVYVPKSYGWKAIAEIECSTCKDNYKWYYVSATSGQWLRLLDDKKLQKIEQDAEKEAQDEYLKKESELEEKQKADTARIEQLDNDLKEQEKSRERQKKEEEKEQLKKEKAEKQKEARELQKRLKALQDEEIEITNTGEIPETEE